MPCMWDKYLLVPWRDGGRDFTGCDCWGLVRLVFAQEYNIDLPDYRIGCKEVSRIHSRIETERLHWPKLEHPTAPCIVLIQDPEAPEFYRHMGIYIGNKEMLHMKRRTGAARIRIDHPAILPFIEGYYEPP